jgi:hypothetical protein
MHTAPSRAFFRPIRTTTGLVLEGQMMDVKDTSTVRDFTLPRRQLLTSITSPARPGMIIKDGLRKYLLIDRAEKTRNMTRVFSLAEVTQTAAWSREEQSTDLVTGLDRSYAKTDLGMIEVVWELMQVQSDSEAQGGSKYRVLTGATLQLGDMLDGKVVKFVQQVQGITYGEVN